MGDEARAKRLRRVAFSPRQVLYVPLSYLPSVLLALRGWGDVPTALPAVLATIAILVDAAITSLYRTGRIGRGLTGSQPPNSERADAGER
jgi:hypothetical protein